MSTPTVYLVRHGETALNKEQRVRAWLDVPIDKRAKGPIERTAAELALKPLANPLVASDLKRALQTAEIIADRNLLEVLPDERLRPWDVGEFSAKRIDEVGPLMQQYIDSPNEKVPAGESFNDFLDGWKEAFSHYVAVAMRNPKEAIVLVTHSRNIEAARYFVTGDKSTLVIANSVAPGRATAWSVIGGKLVEVPAAHDAAGKREKPIGTSNSDS